MNKMLEQREQRGIAFAWGMFALSTRVSVVWQNCIQYFRHFCKLQKIVFSAKLYWRVATNSKGAKKQDK